MAKNKSPQRMPVVYRGLTENDVAKVNRCLRLIEEAQTLINLAAQELCPVNHFADEWSASHAVYDAIKAYWYRVEGRLQSRRVDEPAATAAAPPAAAEKGGDHV